LQVSGWAARVPVPEVFDSRGTVRTLDDTLLCYPGVYQPLIFCIGVVLLFAEERGRRRGPLDWTRRWGVVCSYVVLLLSATQVLFVGALVMAGIAAVFQSMPLNYQPRVTQPFVDMSTGYLRYGAHPNDASGVVLVASSSIAILLACIPLFDALRSSGRKHLAAVLLAPIALFALMYVAQAGRYFVAFGFAPVADFLPYGVYFRPELFVRRIAGLPPGPRAWGPVSVSAVLVEAAKWCDVLAIAVWLTIARLAAGGRKRAPRNPRWKNGTVKAAGPGRSRFGETDPSRFRPSDQAYWCARRPGILVREGNRRKREPRPFSPVEDPAMKRLALGALLLGGSSALCNAADFQPPVRLMAGDAAARVESPGYAAPCLADLDADGTKELLVGQFRDGKIRVFKHLGAERLTPGEWLQAEGTVAHVPGVW
jgi:hypothetical protein